MDENIMSYFLSINEENNITQGKYASKRESFYKEIENWQKDKIYKNQKIKPIQFTFEITNKCNCNCKHCGMSANRTNKGKSKLTEQELKSLVNDLYSCGIVGYAITGGEPFLEFENICKFIKQAQGKLDAVKIISNGFWGNNVEHYFKQLEKAGFFNNQFFIPSIQISIGEQTVPLEDICNIIHYATQNYTLSDLHLGIIHTRGYSKEQSQLSKLYENYIKKYGKFPENKVYLTDSNYVNANKEVEQIKEVPQRSIYEAISQCENKFCVEIGKFVSPKIFMKCNGDCYPCEVFNMHKDMYIGNYFKDGLPKIIKNMNTNKYVKFINQYGTVFFKEVISKEVLINNYCETSCTACEFCIKYCEKNNLIR